jgi:hypothetical protein
MMLLESTRKGTICLDRNTLWVKELHLKKGAMVMLVTVRRDSILQFGIADD